MAVALVVILSSHHTTGGSANQKSIGTPPTTLPGPTLSGLTASVKSQLTGTGSDNFDVTGVASVICIPPGSWRPGGTFKCYAYDSTKTEIGEYDGTIEPNSARGWQWNAVWKPNLAYTPPGS